MKTWEKRSLGELVEILSGFAFDSNQFDATGELPIVRIRDIIPRYSSTFYSGDYDPKYVIQDGDILIGMDGEFNRARWKGGKALLNQRVCRISTSNQGLDEAYLFHFLPNALKAIEDATPFVTVKHLSVKSIRDIKIPLPPLEEQKRIADILDRAEALRAKRRAALAQLDELVHSVFIEMFGDPVENPKKLEVIKLKDVSEIVSGVTKGRKLAGKSTIFVPYLRVANVQDGYLDLTEIKEIEALPSDIEKYALQKGDILLTEGGDPDKLGRGAVWNRQISNCIHQNHIFRVRINREYLIPEYLSALIGSAYGKKYFLKSAKQTTGIASINSTQLKNFPTLIAPLDLQIKFVDAVQQIKKITESQNQSLLEISSLFDSLTHEAFTGKLFSHQSFERQIEREVKI